MNLVQLASSAAGVAGAISGAVPIVGNVMQLVAVLKQLGDHLQQVPTDPATGQPMTLDVAQAHLAAKVAQSNAQSDKIRQNAQEALAENERLRREQETP